MYALTSPAFDVVRRDSKSQQRVYARDLPLPIFPKDFCYRTQPSLILLFVSEIYPECTQLGG